MSNQQATAPPVNTHTFTVGASDNSANPQKFLMKDGRVVQCHKQPPIILPTHKSIQTGEQQFEAKHIHCNLDCGKANIVEYSDGVLCWQQTCDPIGLSVRLQNAEEAAAAGKEKK